MQYALEILNKAREREQILLETELQNSKVPEVYTYTKRIEQLGAAIDLINLRIETGNTAKLLTND